MAAVALQIFIEKITATLALYQNRYLESPDTQKDQKSFGYWCTRRCDVYVVSYQPGFLAERLEIAAMLWKHNISTDVMYESAFRDEETEDYLDMCRAEGILYASRMTIFPASVPLNPLVRFIVHAKPRAGSTPVYKVKSVLRGTETEGVSDYIGTLFSALITLSPSSTARSRRVPSAPYRRTKALRSYSVR